MATVFNQNEEDQNQAPSLNSGQGAFITGGAQPAAVGANPNQPKQAGSGRFQNLQKYIGANQQGAQQIGQKVQGNIVGQADKYSESVNQTGQKLQEGANQEIGRINAGQQFVNDSLANATNVVNDQDKFNQFQQYRTGQNTQQDIQNYGQLQNKAQDIKGLSDATKSEQGRLGLLKQTFQAPNYSQGASRLDQLLMQSRPNELRNINKQTAQAANTGIQKLGNLQTQKDQYNTQIKNLADQQAAYTGQALQTNQQDLVSSVDKKVTEAQSKEAARKAISDKISGILAQGNAYSDQDATKEALKVALENKLLTDSQQNTVLDAIKKINSPIQTLMRQVNSTGKGGYLGYGSPGSSSTTLSPGESRYSDLNIRSLLRDSFADQGAGPINRQTVTTQEELARANALAKLADQTAVLNGMEQMQAGKANFDINGLNRKVDADIARLNQDTLIDLPSTYAEKDGKLTSTLTASPEQSSQDIQNDLSRILNKSATPEQRAAAFARIYGTILVRLPAGAVAQGGSALAKDVNGMMNSFLDPSSLSMSSLANPLNNTSNYLTGSANNTIASIPGGSASRVGGEVQEDVQAYVNALLNPGKYGSKDSLAALSRPGANNGILESNKVTKAASRAGGVDNVLNSITDSFRQADASKAATAAFNAAKASSGLGAIRRIFCHLAGAFVKLEDGTDKLIQDIKVGDITMLGGLVKFVGQAFATDDVYDYKGTLVTGMHAVYENGKWLRVKDSEYSQPMSHIKSPVVYFFENENHKFIADGTIWADFYESDNHCSSNEESLAELNVSCN